MQDQITQFQTELAKAQSTNLFASFLTRRLSAIGAVYALVFGAFLLLAVSWSDEDKETGETSGLFSYFDESTFAQVMDYRVQLVVALAVLFLCMGRPRNRLWVYVLGALLLAPVVLMPLLLIGDIETVILMRFMHAVLLLASGLILDRTFGYTRALARSNFYLARLNMVRLKPDSEQKTEELNKLFEAFLLDKYRDHIGDTFFTLDAIKAKLSSN